MKHKFKAIVTGEFEIGHPDNDPIWRSTLAKVIAVDSRWTVSIEEVY